MTKCTECGVQHHIYPSGYLFVEGNHSSSTYEYRMIDELEQLLNKLMMQEVNVQVAITAQKVKPTLFSPLSTVFERVINRHLVQIIQSGELVGHIQPIIDLQKNVLFGFESLLRIQSDHPVSPGKLFQVAGKTGMLSILDVRAREVAIQTRRKYIKKGVKSFINFLPSTIYNPEFCLQHTFHLVKKYGIDPSDLVFEVVETEKIEDVEHLQNVFITYKKQGMQVALDDVGSGFATIEMLERLRPDYVKVDRSYIDHCDTNKEKQSFLNEVQYVAKGLDIQVLAEGIEREEELEFCRELGMNLAQGYFLGRPNTAEYYKNL